MDAGRAFTFVFEEKNWLQVILIGGLVLLVSMIVPVVGWFAGISILTGYMLVVLKNTRDGDPLPLPPWDDFWKYFNDGLMLMLAMMVYALPLILIVCVVVASMFAAILVPAIMESEAGEGVVVGMFSVFWCAMPLVMLYGLLVVIIQPAICISYSEDMRWQSAFDFARMRAIIKADVGNYVMAIILMTAANLIASVISQFTFGIGGIFASFWAMLVQAFLFGELARGARQTASVSVTR